MINEFLYPNLPPNSGTLWFQQVGATAHTAVISIAAFRSLSPQTVISRFGDVPWPPRSPDLTASDFFLWGYLKSKVYSTRPTDLHALKENIREEIAKLLKETLQAVKRSFLTRVHLCIEEGGGHLRTLYSTIVNCDVLKLVSITCSKMLFLFIISSLFLPHPVLTFFKIPGPNLV